MGFVTAENTTKDQRRAIFTDEGYVTIEPGASRVVNVSDADQAANKEYFKFSKASQKDADEQEAAQADEQARINPPQPIDAPVDDKYAAMSEDMLRDDLEDKTGKRPHANLSRAKLIEQHQAAFAD